MLFELRQLTMQYTRSLGRSAAGCMLLLWSWCARGLWGNGWGGVRHVMLHMIFCHHHLDDRRNVGLSAVAQHMNESCKRDCSIVEQRNCMRALACSFLLLDPVYLCTFINNVLYNSMQWPPLYSSGRRCTAESKRPSFHPVTRLEFLPTYN